MGVSQSGYLAWKNRALSRRQRDDLVMLAHLRSACSLSNEIYGSPRMTRELQEQAFSVGCCRTARLMRQNKMQARQKRRFKKMTDSHHSFPIARNILAQEFSAKAPNHKWGADILYIWTREGWLYLTVVIDLLTRRVISRAVSDRLHHKLALQTLENAITMRRPPKGLNYHLASVEANIVPLIIRQS